MKIFVWCFMIGMAHAQEWKRSAAELNFFSDAFQFSNRAYCAGRANSPTKTAFLLLDNVNVAKASFRLAKLKGLDPVQVTNLATNKFRYTVASLISLISDKLLTGKLPLIDDGKVSFSYLREHWEKSEGPLPFRGMSCQIIKKWGSLHSYLNVSKPDRFHLEQIAKDLEEVDQFIAPCEELATGRLQEVDLLRFKVPDVSDFEKTGFRFWYSLKVYLSWAFRHSRQMEQLATPFDDLFRSADLEEMLLFMSAGCESMDSPECSEGQLNLQSIGALTTPADALDLSDRAGLRPVGGSPTDQFFTRPLPLKEDDLLNLTKFATSEEWARNFRNNFIQTRGLQKIQLSTSLTNLHIIQKVLTAEGLLKKIEPEARNAGPEWRKDLFYLCAEYDVAGNKFFSALKSDLVKLSRSPAIAEVTRDLSLDDIDHAINLYLGLSSSLTSFCRQLEESDHWRGFTPDRSGFAPWYLQLTRDEIVSPGQEVPLSALTGPDSYVKLYGTEVFCKSGIHCARILLNSLFTLATVSRSLSTMLPKEVPSANIGNPFSAHVACGAYDPWAKRNRVIFEFFHDLAQAALFGLLPSPVYVSAELKPKQLISFSELIKDGKVFYDPRYRPGAIGLSLTADLGPLMGAPCAISVSGSRLNPLEYYSFSGISFSGCLERGESQVHVTDDEIQSHSHTRSFCGACAINLSTAVSSLASVNPIARVSAFLIKAIVRLSNNLKDPHDLPRAWQVSSQKVSLSYRFHGEIDRGCARKLLKGKSCLPKSCQRELIEEFTRLYEVSPVATSFNCFLGRGKVFVKECASPIVLSSASGLSVKTSCALKRRSL